MRVEDELVERDASSRDEVDDFGVRLEHDVVEDEELCAGLGQRAQVFHCPLPKALGWRVFAFGGDLVVEQLDLDEVFFVEVEQTVLLGVLDVPERERRDDSFGVGDSEREVFLGFEQPVFDQFDGVEPLPGPEHRRQPFSIGRRDDERLHVVFLLLADVEGEAARVVYVVVGLHDLVEHFLLDFVRKSPFKI